jgi:chromosome segregation ATPase
VVDLSLVAIGLVGVLLAATTYAAIEYYRQLRRAQKEYEKARNSVEDIVLSFNRELKREAEAIQLVAYKIEGNAAKADAGLKKAELVEKRLLPLENQVGAQNSTFNTVSESNAKTIEKVAQVDSRVHDIEATQETLKNKISGLEGQMQKISTLPEIKSEQFLPVIPLKRDKAMAALTDTEIAVLEFLTSEGPKTAPEIKEKVQLSREHTARLMKKLYEEGYLERETGKLPFKYSIKKEMERLLKKPDTPAA